MSIEQKFKTMQVKKSAFNKIKRIVERDTLITYPVLNETFKMHTNAIAFQLVAVISLKGKGIAFHSRRINDDRQHFTVTDKELLNIV